MFDKNFFGTLLAKAIGDRTATEYSAQSGVNRTYISKILNKSLENPPSPEILKGLADVAQNGVTYIDFMQAAGYLREYSDFSEEVLNDEDFNRILPLIVEHLNESIIKYDDNKDKKITDAISLIKTWEYLDNNEKIELFKSIFKKIKYNKTTGGVSFTQYFIPSPDSFQIIKEDYLNFLAEQDEENVNIKSPDRVSEETVKYTTVDDVEEAMKIILEQPGLMLKGSILSDESKIILANAIQMGLKTAEELEKKKNKGDLNE